MTVTQILLAGRYRLRNSLGSGGMGRVWLARDEVLRRDVAVKEVALPSGLSDEEREELRLRTMREARAAARLSHPNVVQIYDVVRSEEQPWIVMEYVPSRSLHQVVNDNGPLGVREVAVIGLAMLSALEAAHRSNVLHRDVKPGNVLIAEDGRIVLSDFGLAIMDEGEGAVTQTGLILGSPQYISPERAQNGTSTPEADLWSLGATLYAAVEGRAPYSRPTALGTLIALATERPDPMHLAGDLKPVLSGLMRREPRARLTVGEARWLLWQVARGEAVARVPRFKKNRRSIGFGVADVGTPITNEITPRLAELARQSSARAQLTRTFPLDGSGRVGPSPISGPLATTATGPAGSRVTWPVVGTASVPAGTSPAGPVAVPGASSNGTATPSGAGVSSGPVVGADSGPVIGPERRHPWRWAAAGTVAAVAAASAVTLGPNLLPGRPATTAGPNTQGVTTLAAEPTGQAVPANGSPAPSPSTPDPDVLPAGLAWYTHPTGFRVPVPTNWTTVTTTDTGTVFCAPGGPPVMQVALWQRNDPLPVTALQYEEIAAKLPDYRRIRIEPLAEGASAEWEYSFQDPKMGPLHGLDRVFVVAGKAYLIQWRTSPADWLSNLGQLQLITRSFRPIHRPAAAAT
jgi:serine/threonine protein kinase